MAVGVNQQWQQFDWLFKGEKVTVKVRAGGSGEKVQSVVQKKVLKE